MSNIKEFASTPDIVLTDTKSLAEDEADIIADYCKNYTAETKMTLTLSDSDPIRLTLMTYAARYYQLKQYIEQAGRKNFLKYAGGTALDNLGLWKQLYRKEAEPAKTVLRFSMTDARTSATGIPAGTRVCTADKIYFAVDSYTEIPIGALYADVPASALEPGRVGNGIGEGLLNIIVDPLPYIAAVTNISVSSGGADVESDDDFTYRIYAAPAGYSTAGPYGAYEYFARTYRGDIGDVYITSPAPKEVWVGFTLEDGSLPDETVIEGMEAHLSDQIRRPLTDLVTVEAPEEVSYNIDMLYTISKSNAASAATIQAAVTAAVSSYQQWQRKIGKAIIPSKLVELTMQAGARRAEVTSPVYTVVSKDKIPKAETVSVVYGGLEDD